jgi:hypothetical protein
MPPARKKTAAAVDSMAADAAASVSEPITVEVLVVGLPGSTVKISGAPGFKVDGYGGEKIAIQLFGRTLDEAVASCSAEATADGLKADVSVYFSDGRIWACVKGAIWTRERIDLKLKVTFK